jgi:hypothetical protein
MNCILVLRAPLRQTYGQYPDFDLRWQTLDSGSQRSPRCQDIIYDGDYFWEGPFYYESPF